MLRFIGRRHQTKCLVQFRAQSCTRVPGQQDCRVCASRISGSIGRVTDAESGQCLGDLYSALKSIGQGTSFVLISLTPHRRRVWPVSVIAFSPRPRRRQPAAQRNAINELRVNLIFAYGTAEGLEHTAVGSGTPSGTTAVPSGIGSLATELSVSHPPAASMDSVFGISGPVSGGF